MLKIQLILVINATQNSTYCSLRASWNFLILPLQDQLYPFARFCHFVEKCQL